MPGADAIAADCDRYRIEHEHPDCSYELYRDVILLHYYSAKEGGPFGNYVLYLKGEDRWIGHCPLMPRLCSPDELARMDGLPSHSALEVEVGWAVSLYYRRQGYATEAARALLQYAFNTLGVRRVIAFTDHDNLASIQVMRRLQMHVDMRPDSPEVIGWAEPV